MSVFLEIVLFQRTRLTNVYVFEYKKKSPMRITLFLLLHLIDFEQFLYFQP